jgi:hypothetical protein
VVTHYSPATSRLRWPLRASVVTQREGTPPLGTGVGENIR